MSSNPNPDPTPGPWEFQIEQALSGSSSWFTGHLIRLLSRSDLVNLERFRLGFPVEVAAWEAYKRGGMEAVREFDRQIWEGKQP